MQLDRSLQANITYRYYQSGHMIYIHPGSTSALRRDLSSFYDSAAQ
jgi:carboxypeptidase C (cathepsin A)